VITFSNHHSFEYVAASGALAYNGKGWPWEWPFRWLGLINPRLFTIFTKTLTYYSRKGNLRWWKPWGCVRLMNGGVVNAVGLTNPGISWWCDKIGPKLDPRLSIAVSILNDDVIKIRVMAEMLNDFNIVAIELNASCPNIGHDPQWNADAVIKSCEVIKQNSRHPLILKLGFEGDVKRITKGIKGIVEALSINSVPWSLRFPNTTSPLEHLGGGGVSGKIAQCETWELLSLLTCISDIPVIGPSVWEFEDIERIRLRGAHAVSFGSLFLAHPHLPTRYAKKDIEARKKTVP